MKQKLMGVVLMGILTMFSSCTHRVENYAKNEPAMSIRDYFNGPIHAWGIVQNWKGEVTRRFEVKMEGKWEGNTGKLYEHFTYDDGETQERVWTITQLADGSYEGRADDIVEKATGETSGNAARWNYVMDLKVKDDTYRVRFDDWMWLMDNKTLFNRSYIKKFGMTVAELSIFMQKQ